MQQRSTAEHSTLSLSPSVPVQPPVVEMPKCYAFCGIGIPLRYFSLCALVFQTTAAVLLTRFSKVMSTASEPYASTSLVVSTEIVKFCLSLLFIFLFDVPAFFSQQAAAEEIESGVATQEPSFAKKFHAWKHMLHSQNLKNPLDTLKLAIPALLYTIQNNMIYVALSNLEATTFQVGYQSKVITTAVLSVLMLNRSLSWMKWASLMLLTSGIVCTQITNKVTVSTGHVDTTVGVVAVLISAFCSAFAGVYFEKILKGSNPSVWMRNAQLAFFSTIVGIVTYYLKEPTGVRFFQGYDNLVLSIIAVQAAGGLIIAVVVKYADNILKGFATALSIVFCGILSMMLLEFQPGFLFMIGSAMAIAATMMYSM